MSKLHVSFGITACLFDANGNEKWVSQPSYRAKRNAELVNRAQLIAWLGWQPEVAGRDNKYVATAGEMAKYLKEKCLTVTS